MAGKGPQQLMLDDLLTFGQQSYGRFPRRSGLGMFSKQTEWHKEVYVVPNHLVGFFDEAQAGATHGHTKSLPVRSDRGWGQSHLRDTGKRDHRPQDFLGIRNS